MFQLLGLVSSVLFTISVPAFGQTAVTQSSEQAVVEEVDWEELEPEVPSLSQEEFDAQFSNWENLGKTPLQQYLDSFDLFLETSLPQYDMQPYVLAECLWFQVAVLPKFQKMKEDGSLDVERVKSVYELLTAKLNFTVDALPVLLGTLVEKINRRELVF
jgi:hypothetical protein